MSIRSVLWRAGVFTAGVILAAAPGGAQTSWFQTLAPGGVSPTGSYAIDDLETIDNVYGGVSWRIPLASLPPGRAGFSMSLPLVYNSNIWDVVQVGFPPPPQNSTGTGCDGKQGSAGYYDCLVPSTSGGWRYGNEYGLDLVVNQSYNSGLTQPNCPNSQGGGGVPSTYKYYQLSAVFPDGSHHLLYLNGALDDQGSGYYQELPGETPACPGASTHQGDYSYFTADGTYLKVVIVANQTAASACPNPTPNNNCWTSYTWTMYFPDGTQVTGQASQASSISDRNGNTIRVSNVDSDLPGGATQSLQYVFQDDLQRNITVLHELTPNSGTASTDFITQTGVNGSSLTWTVQWNIMYLTGFNTYPCGPGNCSVTAFPVTGVTAITFPPTATGFQPTYNFGYGLGNWGQINSVTQPSGANVGYLYQYDGASNYAMSPPHNPILTKTLNWCDESDLQSPVMSMGSCPSASARADQWRYSFGNTSSIATGPDGGATTTSFYNVSLNPSSGAPIGGVNAGLVFTVQAPDGSTAEQQWTRNSPLTTQDTSIANPIVAFAIHSVSAGGAPSQAAVSQFSWDLNGNRTLEADYDFVPYSSIPRSSGAPAIVGPQGTLLKTTSQMFVASPASASDPNGYWNESSPNLRALLSCGTVTGPGNGAVTAFIYDSGNNTNGNVTQEQDWDSTQQSSQPACPQPGQTMPGAIVLNRTWDAHGNLTSASDGNGNTSQITWDSQSLYLKQSSGSNVPGITNYSFDFNSGLLVSRADYNGLTTANTFDDLGRITRTNQTSASGLLRMTSTIYDDANRRIAAFNDNVSPGDQQLVSVTDYDQLGRQRLTRQLESSSQAWNDDTAGIKVQTRYGYSGNLTYQIVSNPYRADISSDAGGEATMGWTLTASNFSPPSTSVVFSSAVPSPSAVGCPYSGTGRQVSCTSGTAATLTDEAGVQRTNTVDGLGRLTSVLENGISATTNYSYDVLGNLTGVTPATFATNCATPQGVNANRGFFYDSLGRLGAACNPESGSTTYIYDHNSNLKNRTDGRGRTATINYDAFNRPLIRTYNDNNVTPPVTYSWYPGQDFLASVASGAATYTWSNYDALGRPGAGVQTVSGQGSWTFPSVVWTPQGQISSITYPSGRTVSTSFDAAGRPTGVVGLLNGTPTSYASVPPAPAQAYAAHGALSQVTLGDNVTRTFGYNAQLQMTSVGAGSLMTLGFGYGGIPNNGNLQSQTISRPSVGFSATQNYGYTEGVNGVNRLTSAAEGSTWSQGYLYDNVGNRSVTANSSIPAGSFTPTGNNAFNSNNQWAGVPGQISAGYDAAGNMTSVSIASPAVTETMGFDAESRMTSWNDSSTGGSVSITYDGGGRRVTKTSAGTTTIYVYDPGGNLAVEYGGSAPGTSGTQYLTQDHLGSTRLVTNASGTVVGCHDYLPFGEEIPGVYGRSGVSCYGAVDTAVKFTGQERDPETAADLTGFDNFQARMMAGTQGRFLSPDPDNAGADPTNPQSWNMYGYVGNNPLAFIDPSGMFQDCPGGTVVNNQCVQSPPDVPLPGDCLYLINQISNPACGGGLPAGPNITVAPPRPAPPQRPPTGRPKQTFSQCMTTHANDFSILGAVNAGTNALFNRQDTYKNNVVLGALGGNSITSLLYGSTADAAGTGVTLAPTIVTAAMGTVTSYGRRTSTIMSLNIAGSRGLPLALGASSAAAKSGIDSAGKWLGLGLDFEVKLGIDATFAAAEAAYCYSQTQ